MPQFCGLAARGRFPALKGQSQESLSRETGLSHRAGTQTADAHAESLTVQSKVSQEIRQSLAAECRVFRRSCPQCKSIASIYVWSFPACPMPKPPAFGTTCKTCDPGVPEPRRGNYKKDAANLPGTRATRDTVTATKIAGFRLRRRNCKNRVFAMNVLSFPAPKPVGRVSIAPRPRPRTRCESCGAPTVRLAGAEVGTVRLCCDSCAHVWATVDRRQAVRPTEVVDDQPA